MPIAIDGESRDRHSLPANGVAINTICMGRRSKNAAISELVCRRRFLNHSEMAGRDRHTVGIGETLCHQILVRAGLSRLQLFALTFEIHVSALQDQHRHIDGRESRIELLRVPGDQITVKRLPNVLGYAEHSFKSGILPIRTFTEKHSFEERFDE